MLGHSSPAAVEAARAFGEDRKAMSAGMMRQRPQDAAAAYKSYLRRLSDMLDDLPFELGDRDKLNYLAGRDFDDISKTVSKAVATAHIKGDVPNISISVPARNEEGFAALVCFFELSCALSAYVSGVNPFNQPGVETYKSNMFKLLGQE